MVEQEKFDLIMDNILSLGISETDTNKLAKEIIKNAFHTGCDRIYLAQCVYNILAIRENNFLSEFKKQ